MNIAISSITKELGEAVEAKYNIVDINSTNIDQRKIYETIAHMTQAEFDEVSPSLQIG